LPNIRSAKKRVKIIATKTARNKACKSCLKTAVKKALASINDNSADSQEAVKSAVSAIDKAASKGVIHKNNAARKKSALVLKLNKAKA
jgi:small subunit ribosomal protein S20